MRFNWTYPHYPSVTTQTIASTTVATSTEYIYAGDTLIAYIEQAQVNGAATGTPATYYVHTDHLGSTNAITTAGGAVRSAREYFPFGSTRVQSGNQGFGRGYIGEFQDSDTMSYLNSRYYQSDRGQFLSEDPSFLAIGDPNKLQQLAQDQQRLLADPQSLNSYSYSQDNPITNKDPLGLWAFRFGISGTIPLWGLTGEAGMQADLRGVEYYYGTGLAGGGGFSLGPQITTANLAHQYSISTAVFAEGGVGASVEISKGMTYYPYSDRKPDPYQEASFGFPAAQLRSGVMGEVSGPIPALTFSKRSTINYSLPKPQMVSSINYSVTNQSANTSRSNSGSGSASYSQTLSNLQSALQQLSAVLSAYQSKSH